MKKVLLTAVVLGALTSCGQLTGNLVDRLYPDGVSLGLAALPLPSGSAAADHVIYLQISVFEGVDAVIHSVMKEWPVPQLLGDVTYVRRSGSVTGIDLYLRPDLDGCVPLPQTGIPAVSCSAAGESAHRLGPVTVSTSQQTWGPLASTTLRQSMAARKGYVGIRVTSGQAATGEELSATIRIGPG